MSMSSSPRPLGPPPGSVHDDDARFARHVIRGTRELGLDAQISKLAKEVVDASDGAITNDEISDHTAAVTMDYDNAQDKTNINFVHADPHSERLRSKMPNSHAGHAALERIKHTWVSKLAMVDN